EGRRRSRLRPRLVHVPTSTGGRVPARAVADGDPSAPPAGTGGRRIRAAGMIRLALRGVTRWYPGSSAPVLSNLYLEVHEHETLCVLGASGAGKSTLVRLLADLDEPQGGAVDRGADGRRPALVPQSADLFPWLTVAENVGLGGRYAANADHFRPARVTELLDDLGIADLAGSVPAELSGGQAQRV